jgi:hypothetical protein
MDTQNDYININGNMVSFYFKALQETNETDIRAYNFMLTDQNGNVMSSVTEPYSYETVSIQPTSNYGVIIPVSKIGLMTLQTNFGDSRYDQTGDGRMDIQDLLFISKQLTDVPGLWEQDHNYYNAHSQGLPLVIPEPHMWVPDDMSGPWPQEPIFNPNIVQNHPGSNEAPIYNTDNIIEE